MAFSFQLCNYKGETAANTATRANIQPTNRDDSD
jgi:hypothetical protein